MKLFLLFLTVALFQVQANTYGQNTKVSLDMKEVPLAKVIDEIERNTEFRFLYSSAKTDLTRMVTIKVKKQRINSILKVLFADTNTKYKVIEKQIILMNYDKTSKFQKRDIPDSHITQQLELRGIVTDKSGAPLPGANILEKGTTNGTQTDFDGKFSLTATDENPILVISYLGFTTKEINTNDQTNFTIVLEEDAAGLDEVVVIGYGTVRKSDLTGSIGTLKSIDIQKQRVTTVDQALQGRLSGVQVTTLGGAPGSGASIRIRGGNSINAGNEPLYVIDGFIGGGNLNTINPADIESIQVLKDASATAIYGSRGSNGVILITTKRGSDALGPEITYESNVTFQNPVKRLDLLKGREFAEFRNEWSIYNGVDPASVPFLDLDNIANTDWQDVLFGTGIVQNHNLSISNRTENSGYFAGFNYLNDKGIVLASEFSRYQLRFNFDQKFGSSFKIGASLTAIHTNRDNPRAGGVDLLPTAPIYNDDGTFFSENQINGFPFNNPLVLEKYTIDETKAYRTLGNVYAQWMLVKGLTLKSTFGFDVYTTKNNRYSSVDLPTSAFFGNGGIANVDTGFSASIQNENTITYDLTLNEDHNLDLLGGYTYQNFKFEGLNAEARGLSNDATLFNALETGDPVQQSINSNESTWTLLSALFRINYRYKGKYLLTVSGRNDSSSRLSEGNQSQFFPSIAVGWKLSEENFINNLGVFDNLKLRASYGKTGSQSINPYATLPRLNAGSTVIGGTEVTTFVLGLSANESLGWEVTEQFNVGLEASFFKNRLNIEVDYYSKETNDLLLSRELPFQTGFESRLENIGSLENKGLEFNINALIIQNDNFSWESTLTLASNKNEIINLGDKEFLENGTGSRLIVGESVGTFFGAKYLGVWQEGDDEIAGHLPGDPKFEDLNEDGIITVEDGQILGDAVPNFYGGLNNTFTYNNFSVTMFFDFSQGNDIYDLAGRDFNTGFITNVYGKYRNRWTPQNVNSNIPRAGSNFTNFFDSYAQESDLVISDGSYLRLKTLNLQYNIPINDSLFKDLSVYVIGTNLFTITKYEGFTPDVNSEGTNATRRGFDNNVYPQGRGYTLGIRAKF